VGGGGRRGKRRIGKGQRRFLRRLKEKDNAAFVRCQTNEQLQSDSNDKL
jgi:hypothetical protein